MGYEVVAETPVVVSTAGSFYFVTDKYFYRIQEPITFTVGNDQYPLIWLEWSFLGFMLEKFENRNWENIGGGWGGIFWPSPLEFQESFTWTDSMGLSEPGLYRFKHFIRFGSSDVYGYLISNAFVVE